MLGDVVALSELEIAGGVRLPSDVPRSVAVDPIAGGGFHWAPLHVDAADRLHVMVGWMASHQPAGVVIDVSVEAAVTCRLAGVPTVAIRQLGRRGDRAHELAYRTAQRRPEVWHSRTLSGLPGRSCLRRRRVVGTRRWPPVEAHARRDPAERSGDRLQRRPRRHRVAEPRVNQHEGVPKNPFGFAGDGGISRSPARYPTRTNASASIDVPLRGAPAMTTEVVTC